MTRDIVEIDAPVGIAGLFMMAITVLVIHLECWMLNKPVEYSTGQVDD